MIQATKWGAKAILTDKTAAYLSLRGEMSSASRRMYTNAPGTLSCFSTDAEDWNSVAKEVGPIHSFSNVWYYTPINAIYEAWETFLLQRTAGPLAVPLPKASSVLAAAALPSSKGDTTVSA